MSSNADNLEQNASANEPVSDNEGDGNESTESTVKLTRTGRVSKVPKMLECVMCKFSTTKKAVYEKHLLTAKHKYISEVNDAYDKHAELMASPDYVIQPLPPDSLIRTVHRCGCGKIYKHRQSLCIHKKVCTFTYQSLGPTAKEKAEIEEKLEKAKQSRQARQEQQEREIEHLQQLQQAQVSRTNTMFDDVRPDNTEANEMFELRALRQSQGSRTNTMFDVRPDNTEAKEMFELRALLKIKAMLEAEVARKNKAKTVAGSGPTDPADIILIDPLTPTQVRAAVLAIDSYDAVINAISAENTFPDTVIIADSAASAILVTAESMLSNLSVDSSISAVANAIASSFSEETHELCIHREVVVRCIKVILPLYFNILTRMNLKEDEDLPESMVVPMDPDAPLSVGYLELKTCINILYFILSRIDEHPVGENKDDVIDISR